MTELKFMIQILGCSIGLCSLLLHYYMHVLLLSVHESCAIDSVLLIIGASSYIEKLH